MISETAALRIRRSIIEMTHTANASHVGACLSIADMLAVLYFDILKIDPARPDWQDRDRFILSKGHGSAALYAALAERGFFPAERLGRYHVDGGLLPGHLDRDTVPGVEASTGSLGHGLSIGVGMAIANRRSRNPGRVFVLLGDGECNEGSVWEAVMLAATLRLDNLTALVDYNRFQAFGRTNEVIDQSNMTERWKAFGWETHDVDGHRIDCLREVLLAPQQGPKAVIAHTVKGKGVSFMEDRLEWHYKSPDRDQRACALRELGEPPCEAPS